MRLESGLVEVGRWTRRGVLAGAALLASRGAGAQTAIGAIEARGGGRLGVFVLDTGSGRMLAHRADERFSTCSTFKGLLAAFVLSRVDAGEERLDRMVPYGEQDLLSYAPVTRAHVRQGALPLGALCAAIVEVSDNTAANLLLRQVGGPARLTRFYRSLGDGVTRSDRFELALNDRSEVLDTTTPRAIAGSVKAVVLGDALSPGSRATLDGWLTSCRTGLGRLRAALPPAWAVADKTGTGDGICNDYAIARPPGRAPLVMAAYYDAPGMATQAQEAVLRETGAAIARWAG